MSVTLGSGSYREVDACTCATSTQIFASTKLVRPLEHRLGSVASMKLCSGTTPILLK
jgi:hypothetical protein